MKRKKRTCRNIQKKILGKFCIITILAVLGTSATYTYVQHKIQQDNILQARTVAIRISETPDSGFQIDPGANIPKNVKFVNDGSAAVFLRISYVETWLDSDGNWLGNKSGYAVPHWNNSGVSDPGIDSALWFDGGDDWYYYKRILPSGEATELIMTGVIFDENLPDEYREGHYELLWAAEVVQCSADQTITDGKTVNEAALSAAFGRAAEVSDLQVVDSVITAGTANWN